MQLNNTFDIQYQTTSRWIDERGNFGIHGLYKKQFEKAGQKYMISFVLEAVLKLLKPSEHYANHAYINEGF